MLGRDLRSGELRVLAAALVLAVAALSAVAFFTDRVDASVMREAGQLLGGDLLLASDRPIDAAYRAQARALGLGTVQSASFTSMALAGEHSQLVGVKVVETGYPLRGRLRVAPGLNRPDADAVGIPPAGTVWLDERASTALSVAPGDTLQLGEARLRVNAVLTFESDRGMGFFSMVPRLMLNATDLPATALVQEGSRVAYRLHMAGEPPALAAMQQWLAARVERGQRIESLETAQPEVRGALERARQFLRLAAMLAVVFAAVAVGLAARRYLRRHVDGCAVMRCMGATQAQLLRLFLGEFVLLGLACCALGCLFGYAAQFGVEALLSGLLGRRLPGAGALPLAYGFAVGMTLILGFVLPQLLRLRAVSTVRVLRREWDGMDRLSLGAWLAGLGSLSALVWLMAGDLKLGVVVVGGFVVACALYAVLARGALLAVARLRGGSAAGWRYGLASLTRRGNGAVVQISALAIGLSAMLLLLLARGDLLMAWKNRVPPDAPNRFVINIQPDQRAGVRQAFEDAALAPPRLEPMVRARLVGINGRRVSPDDYETDRARRLVEREFNLSWSDPVPRGNRVVAGRWDAHQRGLSVESGLAALLGIGVGDRLDFEVAGQPVSAPVSALRELEWDSMNVNFFVIASPGVLEAFPASYITAFHLPDEHAGFTNRLVQQMPNLTVIDVAALLRQLQDLMDQLFAAVSVVFGFAWAAGVLVLFAAIESTQDERQFELAVLRTLGARDTQLRQALRVEFTVMGLLAGVLAAVGASAITWALAHFVFKLPYAPGAMLPLAAIAFSALAVLLAGQFGLRRVLRRPPLLSLRE